jgi:DNA-binding transcriptional LysR family regulator
MQDLSSLTLDQVLLFVTVAETGSFSAAARSLDRVQSTVSYGVAQLESQLGVTLFDRSRKKPVLSPVGQALFGEARAILQSVQDWRGHAERLTEGEETELSLVLDRIVPVQFLIGSIQRLKAFYPQVKWVVYSEVLQAITQRVITGEAQLAITGYLKPEHRAELTSQVLGHLDFVIVAAVDHPLANLPSPLSLELLHQHTQLMVEASEALNYEKGRSIWQLSGLWEMKDFAVAGLGWAYLPVHMVLPELRAGSLRLLMLSGWSTPARQLPISVIYRRNRPPGPVGQALLKQWRQGFQRQQSQWVLPADLSASLHPL